MGNVCLQGGGEFSPACREMDAALLSLVGGPVVVTALAAAPGRQYAVASGNGVRHFRACGAQDVEAAPDVREDEAGAVAALRRARLVVLPGGSPARLLTALRTTPVGDLLAELVAAGGGIMGASAGAMVLGAWTVLPERMVLERGLGLVPGIAVLPHWSGARGRGRWLRTLAAVPEPVQVLGLPEESGVLLTSEGTTAVGRSATHLVGAGVDVPVGSPLPGLPPLP